MPRDKSENHIKIIEEAKKEFMNYGFRDASMRRIADRVGITVSGLYKHFQSKEEMFSALVENVCEELMTAYNENREIEYKNADTFSKEVLFESSEEVLWFMDFIYDNFDAFKLILCRSQGTKYENFVHELILMESESTKVYVNKLQKRGLKIKMPTDKEIHLLVTSNINAIFEPVIHDFSKEEAKGYAVLLNTFFKAGWKRIFGM